MTCLTNTPHLTRVVVQKRVLGGGQGGPTGGEGGAVRRPGAAVHVPPGAWARLAQTLVLLSAQEGDCSPTFTPPEQHAQPHKKHKSPHHIQRGERHKLTPRSAATWPEVTLAPCERCAVKPSEGGKCWDWSLT